MKISRKVSSLVAVVLLAGLTLSACGDTDKDDTGTKKESSSSSPDKDLNADEFFTTVLDAQQKAKTSHMVMKVGVGGQSITAEGDAALGTSLDDTAISMSMDMGSAGLGAMKMVLVDGIFYMNLGQVTQGKYAKMDLTDENNAFSQQLGPLLDQMDPSKQLEQFQKAVTSFEKKGDPEQIDGVEAQPYEVVLDTSKVDAMSKLPSGASATVPKTITYVMYVGPDDLLRRMTFEVAGSESQIDYSKWGEDVDVKAPPASEVSSEDISKLLSGAAAS